MPTISKKPRKVAVFDIDGTIFRSSLLIELVKQLVAEEVFPPHAPLEYGRAYHAWLDREGSYEDYIWAVIHTFERHIQGVDEKKVVAIARDVNAANKDRLYRYTRDLVLRLRKKGYFMLAISHSPKYIVEGFAKQLGFDKVYGRYLELDAKGRFTGQTLHTDVINDKARVLERAMEKEHLTLKDSWGVGDTESDVAFLKMVDHPICFNPNQGLYEAAKKRKWKIVVERKDVIYDLTA